MLSHFPHFSSLQLIKTYLQNTYIYISMIKTHSGVAREDAAFGQFHTKCPTMVAVCVRHLIQKCQVPLSTPPVVKVVSSYARHKQSIVLTMKIIQEQQDAMSCQCSAKGRLCWLSIENTNRLRPIVGQVVLMQNMIIFPSSKLI